MLKKEQVIELLQLTPLSREGGMYKKTYRSEETLPDGVLSGRVGPHVAGGAILYLLTPDTYSRMHRLPTDEIWHFYMGAACETTVLLPDGTGYTIRLGQDIANGEVVQAVAPRGAWQGTRLVGDGEWALLGTTLAVDYEPSDYEDGDRDALLAAYPAFAGALNILTGPPRCE